MSKMKYNYRKSKKSILTSILLIFCLMFSGIWLVKANADNNAGGDNSSYPTPSTTPGLKYSVKAVGVRVALVDDKGEKVEGSKVLDIWGKDVISNHSIVALRTQDIVVLNNGTTAENSTKLLRQYVTNSSNINLWGSGSTFPQLVTLNNNQGFIGPNSTDWWINNAASTVGGTEKNIGVVLDIIEWITNKFKNCKPEVSSDWNTKYDCGGADSAQWVDIVLKSLDSPQKYQDLLDAYVDGGGNLEITDPNDLNSYDLVKDSLTDRYIQFEPLVVVLYSTRLANGSYSYTGDNAYWFYGTITEAAYHSSHGDTLISGTKSGIYIKEKKKKPQVFTETYNGVTNLASILKNNGSGQGVAHIYLGDYLKKPTCSAALEQIVSKYGIGTEKYHEKVKELAEGKLKDIFKDNAGNDVQTIVDTPQPYNLLIEDNYKKSNNPFGAGIAACENYIPPDIPTPNCNPKADFYIAACENIGNDGHSWFYDTNNADEWLVCGYAYVTVDGVKYTSENTGHDAIETDYRGVVGNKEYCEIFCTEKIDAYFPGAVTEVKAGMTFTWGQSDGTYGNIIIEKNCSTREGGYKYDNWNANFLSNQETLISKYLEGKAYEDAIPTIYEESSGTCCASGNCCSGEGEEEVCVDDGVSSVAASMPIYRHYEVGVDATTYPGINWMSDKDFTAVKHTESACAYSDAYSEAKNALEATLDSKSKNAYALYDQAFGEQDPILDLIFQCFSNMEYIYKTTVEFIFREPINAKYGMNSRAFGDSWKLEMSYSDKYANGYEENNFNSEKCVEKQVYTYECEGVTCTIGAFSTEGNTIGHHTVLDCELATWEIKGEYIYSYPINEFKWYSLKTNSELVNEKTKGNEDNSFFYSIGFGLPTAFSLTNGQYDMAVVVGNLGDHANLEYVENSYNSVDGHFYPLTDLIGNVEINKESITTNQVYGFEYKCTYSVENDIFGYDCQYDGTVLIGNSPEYCDEDKDNTSNGLLVGIDITYKIISLLNEDSDLSEAFPGIGGEGRVMGKNWADLEINKIYDILDSNVYSGRLYENLGMYEIMLDLKTIKYIRNSNKAYFDSDKDPYTSYYDENNFQKVYCAVTSGDENIKYCSSEFLTDLQTNGTLNYRLEGTCLPEGHTTISRASHILNNGCDWDYGKYDTINWAR